MRLPPSAVRAGLPAALAVALFSRGTRAEPPSEGAPIEVIVRGSTAGSYTSRTSTDTAPRQPIDAASLLAELPSVHVRRLGAEGAFAALSVRGSASSQVGVTLAGIPLTSAADPSLDVGALPLWPGASFRVYRGFAPSALGTTGYLGGVLAVDPPSPALGERTEWWAAAGSFGALKLRLGDLRRVGKLELGTGLFASRSDNDFAYPLLDPATSHLDERTRTNASVRSIGGIERISLERPWGTLSALLFADARRLGVPGPSAYPTRFATLSTSRLVAGADASIRTGSAGAVRVLAWGRRETSDLADPRAELDFTHATTTKSAVEAAGLSTQWRGRLVDALTAAFVIDGRAERFVPLEGTVLQSSNPASRLAAGLGADLEWRARRDLTFAGSARIDARRDSAPGSNAPSGGVAPTGHIGGSYRFGAPAVISLHAGALTRPPSFQELYGNGSSLVGNAALRPERALSVDAGIHGDIGDTRVAFGYELVGFVTSATDLIAFVPAGRTTFHAVNVDRALLAGTEISASLVARGLRTQVSYTLLSTRNQGDSPIERGHPLPGRPRHDLHYDAGYAFGPIGVRYGLDAIAGTTVDTGGSIVLPARVLHGLGAWLDVPGISGLRAGLDVQNLFDLRTLYVDSPLLGSAIAVPVSDFLGFPLPGRSFWVTLRFVRGR